MQPCLKVEIWTWKILRQIFTLLENRIFWIHLQNFISTFTLRYEPHQNFTIKRLRFYMKLVLGQSWSQFPNYCDWRSHFKDTAHRIDSSSRLPSAGEINEWSITSFLIAVIIYPNIRARFYAHIFHFIFVKPAFINLILRIKTEY